MKQDSSDAERYEELAGWLMDEGQPEESEQAMKKAPAFNPVYRKTLREMNRAPSSGLLQRWFGSLNVMSLNDHERELYEARIKARRDENSRIRGEQLIGRVTAYQELLGLRLSSDDDFAVMAVEELTALAEMLRKQLPASTK